MYPFLCSPQALPKDMLPPPVLGAFTARLIAASGAESPDLEDYEDFSQLLFLYFDFVQLRDKTLLENSFSNNSSQGGIFSHY